MKKHKFTPEFVPTKNVRSFKIMMDSLMTYTDEGRLGLIYGRAGHGKTRTSEWYTANHHSIYLRVISIWSELDFLRALCRELEPDIPAPKRKAAAFAVLADALMDNPRPIFLDEVEKLKSPRRFLEIIRDLSDVTTAPVILIGEEELYHLMRQSDRIHSRTYRELRFGPLEAADIMTYTQTCAGITLSASQASILHKATRGDFRHIKRALITLIDLLYGAGRPAPDDDLVRQAIKNLK